MIAITLIAFAAQLAFTPVASQQKIESAAKEFPKAGYIKHSPRLDWVESDSSDISTNPRSLRYAAPLKVEQESFRKAKIDQLPKTGRYYVKFSLLPNVSKDVNQSTVVDICGAVMSYQDLSGSNSSQYDSSLAVQVYAEGSPALWQKGFVISRSQELSHIGNDLPPLSIGQTRTLGNAPIGVIHQYIIVDFDRGVWRFDSDNAKDFPLAPTSPERAVRVYSGNGSLVNLIELKLSEQSLRDQAVPLSFDARSVTGRMR